MSEALHRLASFHLPCDEADPAPAPVSAPPADPLDSAMQAAGFRAATGTTMGAHWCKFLDTGHVIGIRLHGGGQGRATDIHRRVWECLVFNPRCEPLSGFHGQDLQQAMALAKQAEYLLALPPPPQDMPYIEKTAREISRSGRFVHAWLSKCSTGEFAILCLAVGTPAAMKQLHARYKSIGDAWADIDHDHRAVIQRVWEWQRFQ